MRFLARTLRSFRVREVALWCQAHFGLAGLSPMSLVRVGLGRQVIVSVEREKAVPN